MWLICTCVPIRWGLVPYVDIAFKKSCDGRVKVYGKTGGLGWDGMGWDGMGWDGMGWDGKVEVYG